VNTIERLKDGRLKGHDTDGMGFLESLKEEDVLAPQSNSLVMYGAGGAACAVARSLRDAGYPAPDFHVRDTHRVQKTLEHEFPRAQFLLIGDSPNKPQGKALHVHCTPIGLGAREGTPLWDDACAMMEQWLPINMTSCVAVDLIYTPEETPFIQVARSRGAVTVSGLGMLVHQGALAFEIWTQEKAPIPLMWAAAREALDTH
jgi:shikimate dehydrogenase